MLWLISLLLVAAVAVPIAVVAIECACARPAFVDTSEVTGLVGIRTVVCIAAHDEELQIGAALASLQGQLGRDDRVLVVAHNCSDRTAVLARQAGAEVLVLDDGLEGKVHALRAAIGHLAAAPPDIVVVLDADVEAEAGAIPCLVRAASALGAPVQGRYVFEPAENSSFTRSSHIALLVKNEIRYLGRYRLGLPVVLYGAGWAIPFGQLRDTELRADAMAEDFQLTIDLLRRGFAVHALPGAVVRTKMTRAPSAARSQRRRWEHGQIRITLTTAPRLLMRCLARLDLRGATVALHLIVPPLALLAWSWLLTTGISAVTWWTGSGSAPLLVALLSGGLASLVVWRAVARFIGWRTAWSRLSRMPGYVFRKAPMYARYLWDRERRWRRTDRDRSA